MLVKQLPAPLMSVLEETLASHRYALGLDQDNADTLFNTAQVLTSIGEEIAKDDSVSDISAVRYLEEALELLQRCLALQEFRYTEFQEQAAAVLQASEEAQNEAMPTDEAPEANVSPDTGPEQEQWASIVEPVTKDTLLDTALAQLSTLTTLCGILGSSAQTPGVPSLAWIEEYSSKLLNVQLPPLSEATDRSVEAGLAKATFVSAMLEAGYKKGSIDVQTYRRERDAAFSALSLPTTSDFFMANVASLLAFNNALAETESLSTANSDLLSLRWNSLATSISNLATASKLPDIEPDNLPKTHLLRGDASLYQYQLSKPPSSYPPAVKNAAALLKNAEVFYRNASRLTHDGQERDKSRVQEAIVMILEGNVHGGREQLKTTAATRGDDWLRDHIDEVVADGLLTDDDIKVIGLIS